MDKTKWLSLSQPQQLGNIGSEIARARYWESQNDSANQKKALERALELLDLTLDDHRWNSGLKEITRLREIISAWFCGQTSFDVSLKEIEDYCTDFVITQTKKNRA